MIASLIITIFVFILFNDAVGVQADVTRVDRSHYTKHGKRSASFSTDRWVYTDVTPEYIPRTRIMKPKLREPRVRYFTKLFGMQDQNTKDREKPITRQAWEEEVMRSNKHIVEQDIPDPLDDDDNGFQWEHKQRDPIVDWAIPSPLTDSGLDPLVVHIPETDTEAQLRKRQHGVASSLYINRVKAIATQMNSEWEGCVSEHALPEHHLMHAFTSVKKGARQANPPPAHPIHKMSGLGGLDHGSMSSQRQESATKSNVGLHKIAQREYHVWANKWRKWAHDVTSPDHKQKEDKISPWQMRLIWARGIHKAWSDHPEVKTLYLQKPHMRTTRKFESRYNPLTDNELFEPHNEGRAAYEALGTVPIEISDQKPVLRLPRRTHMWNSYRESPAIPYNDKRPAIQYREVMNEKARKRDKNWRVTAPQVGDPLLTEQWNLYDAQAWGDLPADPSPHRPSISSGPACWDLLGFNGSGIAIGVVDSGIEVTHPELIDRYARHLSFDALNPRRHGDPTPVDARAEVHGTAAAGVALATRNNGICGAGIAPGASLGVMRLLGLRSPTDHEEARALSYRCQISNTPTMILAANGKPTFVSVSSNSWGPTDDGSGLHGPGPLTSQAIDACVHRVGRGGLGTIYVWAGGNGRANGDNVNFDGYANRPETIAVGAVSDDGIQSWYSESGACLLVTAPSSGGARSIISSDITGVNGMSSGMCTRNFGGTSAAAPEVAGVVAMMLEANPSLSWRDVQHILIRAAKPLRMSEHRQPWTRNGAGLLHSHAYGFGLLNATKAIVISQQWTNVPHPAVVDHSETLSASGSWRNNPDSPQQRYVKKQVLLKQQLELQKLAEQSHKHKHKQIDPKVAAEYAAQVERIRQAGILAQTMRWGVVKTVSGVAGIWRSAMSRVVERSKANAKAYREAWTSKNPYEVRLVHDRRGTPVGVAIPPGMGANFTMVDGWWKNQADEHQSGKQTTAPQPAIKFLEHVGLQVYMNTPAGRGHLRIRLYSPQGTMSEMAQGISSNDQHIGIDGRYWTYWTVRNWGEASAIETTPEQFELNSFHGQWRLEIWHMEPGQSMPARDAAHLTRGTRAVNPLAMKLRRERVHHPERIDAVLRWWKLTGRGTQH